MRVSGYVALTASTASANQMDGVDLAGARSRVRIWARSTVNASINATNGPPVEVEYQSGGVTRSEGPVNANTSNYHFGGVHNDSDIVFDEVVDAGDQSLIFTPGAAADGVVWAYEIVPTHRLGIV